MSGFSATLTRPACDPPGTIHSIEEDRTMPEPLHRITISDIDIPFFRLVAFFVKASLAAIPAALIVWIVIALFWLVLAAILGPGMWQRSW
jgi:hypothetical protein